MLKAILRNVLILMTLTAASANATPITGQLDFVGAATVTRNATQITSLDFVAAPTVVIADGSFSGLIGQPVGILDPVQLVPISLPITAFWTVGNFEFDLTAIVDNTLGRVFGTGIVRDLDGILEDAVGTWELTTQGESTGIFAFSSTTLVPSVVVPEPNSVALFLLGLVAVGFARQRIRG